MCTGKHVHVYIPFLRRRNHPEFQSKKEESCFNARKSPFFAKLHFENKQIKKLAAGIE